MIRRILPARLKRAIRLAQRNRRDLKSGFNKRLASEATTESEELPYSTCRIQQPIFYNPLSSNKVVNIRLAIAEIEKLVILPGENFSFWHCVGNPTEKKGYLKGRNIIGDRLQEDIGGGLCQVSGMIYHLALVSGMEILERHPHTLDLYEEEKRYTPLGGDATVVYGYKDIRFTNQTNEKIQFRFDVNETEFTGELMASGELPRFEIDFERTDYPTYRTIRTIRKGGTEDEVINSSKYLLINS